MPIRDMHVRPMHPLDLDDVLHIQAASHGPGYLEPRQAFAAKLSASPDTTWVACQGPQVLAYLFALPIDDTRIPTLHEAGWTPPRLPLRLYMHDLAVLPEAQGGGTGRSLVSCAFQYAQDHGLEGLTLVAISGAAAYWTRQGFVALPPTPLALQTQLASYGDGAVLMTAECRHTEFPAS